MSKPCLRGHQTCKLRSQTQLFQTPCSSELFWRCSKHCLSIRKSYRHLACAAEYVLCRSTSGSRRHTLQCGQCLEVLYCQSQEQQSSKPPLLFLHGALHGAWCFEENFLGYFASHGYDAYALSLRGHGQSDYVPGKTGTLSEHVDDIESVITSLARPPVLIAHSLGGLLAQRILADIAQDKRSPKSLAGLAFTSVPAVSAALGPSLKWLQQLDSLLHGFKLVWWMTRMPKEKAQLVRDLFFSNDLPDDKFQAYHAHLRKQKGFLPVDGQDLMELGKVLKEIFPRLSWVEMPILVMASGNDKMIMPCQVEALGEMIGCKVVTVPGVGHDFMLVANICPTNLTLMHEVQDTRWKNAAVALETWIQAEC